MAAPARMLCTHHAPLPPKATPTDSAIEMAFMPGPFTHLALCSAAAVPAWVELLAANVRPAAEFCVRTLQVTRVSFAHEGRFAKCAFPHVECKAEKGGALAIYERQPPAYTW